jgi:hypothetical protein
MVSGTGIIILHAEMPAESLIYAALGINTIFAVYNFDSTGFLY